MKHVTLAYRGFSQKVLLRNRIEYKKSLKDHPERVKEFLKTLSAEEQLQYLHDSLYNPEPKDEIAIQIFRTTVYREKDASFPSKEVQRFLKRKCR